MSREFFRELRIAFCGCAPAVAQQFTIETFAGAAPLGETLKKRGRDSQDSTQGRRFRADHAASFTAVSVSAFIPDTSAGTCREVRC
jgi:hypothetical protein